MIHIGTAGYSYKDWIGPFYPPGTKDCHMLEYYSSHFGFVEVNSSYYHMPTLQLFESINKKTPDNFKIAVKLFGGFTHERNSGSIEAQKFIYAVKPIMESKKLICLLAQFPYSFHYSSGNMDCLKKLRQWFRGIEINVEFRNANWIRRDVAEMLKRENLGFVSVDEPDIKGLVGNVLAFTSNVSYLRMHGRNAEKWYGGKGSERYDYLYSGNELKEWVQGIRKMEAESSVAVISFNNHPGGKAIINAKAMTELLQR